MSRPENMLFLRFVQREQLVSTMNASKWREVTESMRQLPGGPPAFRLKDVGSSEIWPPRTWDREWFHHPRPWRQIEWLEIDPDLRRDLILSILREISVPFTMEDGRVKIWGWIHPPAAPLFAR